jgi:hypothetical protein
VIDVAKADAKAAKLEAQIGRDEAVKKIEEEHREVIAQLDEKQRVQAEALRQDPRKLSKWLAGVGAGRKKG